MALLRQNLDDVAADDFVAQRDHLTVHFRPHALVPDLGVHGIREIDRRRAARQFQHAALRSKCIHFDGSEVHLQRREKLAGFLQLLRPLDQLPHPGDALIVFRDRLVVLVFPVRGDAFLRRMVHFLRPYLHFKRLAIVDHRGVQRLVQVRAWHGDVVFESPGDRPPDVVHHAKRRVAVALVIGNDAHREQIVDLLEAALLANDLAVQRVQTLHARCELRGNPVLHELGANGRLHFFQESQMGRRLVGDFFLQRQERLGLQVAEREIFQLIADQAHAEAVGDGGVNVQGLARDSLLLCGLEIFERAHVVQAVGELHQHDADVVHHGQNHLANVLGLAGFRRHHVQTADLGDAFDQVRDLRAEAFFDARDGKLGVLNDVVEQRCGQRSGVQAQVREDMRDL